MWHAGDWGDIALSDQIEKLAPVRGVYGNIDGHIVRSVYPKELFFECEGLKVFITHIGGYPGRYQKDVLARLKELQPDLFICGHSHILKVMRDKKLNLLHFNPGAIGNKGMNKKRTLLRFEVDQGKISELKVLEYDKNF